MSVEDFQDGRRMGGPIAPRAKRGVGRDGLQYVPNSVIGWKEFRGRMSRRLALCALTPLSVHQTRVDLT